MTVKNEKFLISTNGFCDVIDITKKVEEIVARAEIKNAMVHVYAVGSTVSVVTIEYEPGLVRDLPEILEKLIPASENYRHNETWHDGNGHAHLRATIVGNSVTVPLANGALELGTWQQIVLVDFDNKKRTRTIIVQIIH